MRLGPARSARPGLVQTRAGRGISDTQLVATGDESPTRRSVGLEAAPGDDHGELVGSTSGEGDGLKGHQFARRLIGCARVGEIGLHNVSAGQVTGVLYHHADLYPGRARGEGQVGQREAGVGQPESKRVQRGRSGWAVGPVAHSQAV